MDGVSGPWGLCARCAGSSLRVDISTRGDAVAVAMVETSAVLSLELWTVCTASVPASRSGCGIGAAAGAGRAIAGEEATEGTVPCTPDAHDPRPEPPRVVAVTSDVEVVDVTVPDAMASGVVASDGMASDGMASDVMAAVSACALAARWRSCAWSFMRRVAAASTKNSMWLRGMASSLGNMSAAWYATCRRERKPALWSTCVYCGMFSVANQTVMRRSNTLPGWDSAMGAFESPPVVASTPGRRDVSSERAVVPGDGEPLLLPSASGTGLSAGVRCGCHDEDGTRAAEGGSTRDVP